MIVKFQTGKIFLFPMNATGPLRSTLGGKSLLYLGLTFHETLGVVLDRPVSNQVWVNTPVTVSSINFTQRRRLNHIIIFKIPVSAFCVCFLFIWILVTLKLLWVAAKNMFLCSFNLYTLSTVLFICFITIATVTSI